MKLLKHLFFTVLVLTSLHGYCGSIDSLKKNLKNISSDEGKVRALFGIGEQYFDRDNFDTGLIYFKKACSWPCKLVMIL
jgi:hypothetical protein